MGGKGERRSRESRKGGTSMRGFLAGTTSELCYCWARSSSQAKSGTQGRVVKTQAWQGLSCRASVEPASFRPSSANGAWTV